MIEKTLVILKPCTVQRALIGEILHRFERKGLRLAGMKMMQLTNEVLSEHYAHLSTKPFFQRVKDSMMTAPVVVCCFEPHRAAARGPLPDQTGRARRLPGIFSGTGVLRREQPEISTGKTVRRKDHAEFHL